MANPNAPERFRHLGIGRVTVRPGRAGKYTVIAPVEFEAEVGRLAMWLAKARCQAHREAAPFEVPGHQLEEMIAEAITRWRGEAMVRWPFRVIAAMALLAAFLLNGAFAARAPMIAAPAYLLPAVAPLVFFMSRRSRFLRHFRRLLREHGHEVCEGCGYPLAPLRGHAARCPECGDERVPLAYLASSR